MAFTRPLSILFVILPVAAISFACRKSEYIITNEEMITDQGGGTGTSTWSREKTYLLNGFVFVNDGQILSIEPGTVIRAKTGQGSLASALIVARGGKIIAEGEKDDPIIFTVEGDDLQGSVPVDARGLWGGLIILGNARINTESGEDLIEGIPISEPRGVYGGFDDDDNSGILRYVSIRHGGTNIGEGNEINGLTLGGVGRQTIIDHVEVISNADDGFEFFGGDVNCSNLAALFCGDDAFDIDQGYHGKGQFWLAINSSDSDKTLEISGGIKPIMPIPGFQPLLQNTTLIGNMQGKVKSSVLFYSYGGGFLKNSILLNAGMGVSVRYSDEPGDSYDLFNQGKLVLEGNILYPAADPQPGFFCYSDIGGDLSNENTIMADSLQSWGNSNEDPGITTTDGFKLLPEKTVFENMSDFSDPWFEKVTFKGAFGSNRWVEGWTLLYESGYLNN